MEGIIADIRGAGAWGDDEGAGDDADDVASDWALGGGGDAGDDGDAPPSAALADELQLLGFEAREASAAVAATRDAGLSAALDWLCLNLPEARLPANFAPGDPRARDCAAAAAAAAAPRAWHSLPYLPTHPHAGAAGKPVSIIRRADSAHGGGGGSGSSSAMAVTAPAAGGSAESDPAVAELGRWGYPPDAAAQALEAAGGHLHEALAMLYAKLVAPHHHHQQQQQQHPEDGGVEGRDTAAGGPPAPPGDGSSDPLAEWGEERVALEAIFGEGEVEFHSERWTSIRVGVDLQDAAAAAAAGGRHELSLTLDAWAPRGEGPPYPQRAPVLACRAEGAPPAALLTLSRQLGEMAEGPVAGHAML